jgi:hypothetical protein
MKDEIVEKIKSELKLKKEILFIYLYGSFLEGAGFGDIDIALFLDRDISLEDAFDYGVDLSYDLSKETHFSVDARVINSAPSGWTHSVLKNGRPLFTRDEKKMTDLIEKSSWEYMLFYEHSLGYLRDIIG